MARDDSHLVNRLAFKLMTEHVARVRAGDRRSATAARKLLNDAAKAAKVEVAITKSGNGYIAKVK